MAGREYARNRVRSAGPGGMHGGYAPERAFVNENLLPSRDGPVGAPAVTVGDRFRHECARLGARSVGWGLLALVFIPNPVTGSEHLTRACGGSPGPGLCAPGLRSPWLGSTAYTEMVGLILLGRRPSAGETRMLDALLVVLVEPGLVKPVVAARFVYSNAPNHRDRGDRGDRERHGLPLADHPRLRADRADARRARPRPGRDGRTARPGRSPHEQPVPRGEVPRPGRSPHEQPVPRGEAPYPEGEASRPGGSPHEQPVPRGEVRADERVRGIQASVDYEP